MPLAVRWPFPAGPPLPWALASRLVTGLVGTYSCVWTRYLNRLRVHNAEVLHELVERRGPRTPLLTLSNHQSCMDDPHLWGPPRPPTSASPGSCTRASSAWAAVSPSAGGTACTSEGWTSSWRSSTKGTGCTSSLRASGASWPSAASTRSSCPCGTGRITVVVGRPFSVRPLLEQLRAEGTSTVEMRKALTDFVQREFEALRGQARALHPAP
ncbi:tafazzin isoform X20 [Calonectris borealis]|uniref:tafazzin isoform X20 n=1 Tax=Calonectris borealis TaxID=1323832 RepID=UPI003F4BF1AD